MEKTISTTCAGLSQQCWTPECPTPGLEGSLTVPHELTLPSTVHCWHGQGPFVVWTCLCRRWEGASGGSGSGHGATDARHGPTSFLWMQTEELLRPCPALPFISTLKRH